jgi:hypothetical protein
MSQVYLLDLSPDTRSMFFWRADASPTRQLLLEGIGAGRRKIRDFSLAAAGLEPTTRCHEQLLRSPHAVCPSPPSSLVEAYSEFPRLLRL